MSADGPSPEEPPTGEQTPGAPAAARPTAEEATAQPGTDATLATFGRSAATLWLLFGIRALGDQLADRPPTTPGPPPDPPPDPSPGQPSAIDRAGPVAAQLADELLAELHHAWACGALLSPGPWWQASHDNAQARAQALATCDRLQRIADDTLPGLASLVPQIATRTAALAAGTETETVQARLHQISRISVARAHLCTGRSRRYLTESWGRLALVALTIGIISDLAQNAALQHAQPLINNGLAASALRWSVVAVVVMAAWYLDHRWLSPAFDRWHASRWWLAQWQLADATLTLVLLVGVLCAAKDDHSRAVQDAVSEPPGSDFDAVAVLHRHSVAAQWIERAKAQPPAPVSFVRSFSRGQDPRNT